jgi:predicted nucleic acid-binding protein
MAAARKAPRRRARKKPAAHLRYTVDASVFVNAFNRHEEGHAESLAILAAIQDHGDPVIVPTLLLPEVASAVARASDDSAGAVQYADATAALPHLTIVALSSTMARQAAQLAAVHRLRGADSVYVAVARRYGTTLVSRDDEQRSRASAVIPSQTPEDALRNRQIPKRKTRPGDRES